MCVCWFVRETMQAAGSVAALHVNACQMPVWGYQCVVWAVRCVWEGPLRGTGLQAGLLRGIPCSRLGACSMGGDACVSGPCWCACCASGFGHSPGGSPQEGDIHTSAVSLHTLAVTPHTTHTPADTSDRRVWHSI